MFITKRRIINCVNIILGSTLVALSINMFFLRLKIAPGGVSGLSTVLHYITNIPVGTIVILLNIPLFVMGILEFGKKFLLKTIFSTVYMSIFLNYTSFLPQITEDMFLASVFGGSIMGLGLALVFKRGATTGGTDIAAKVVIKHFSMFQISEQLFCIDALVVLTAMIVFKDFDIGLYSIISILVSAKVIDIVFEGVGFSKAIFIISDEGDRIGNQIMYKLERGVTALHGEGMYTNSDKKVLLVVADRRQIPKIKRIAKSYDENSFVIITDVREAMGKGFKGM